MATESATDFLYDLVELHVWTRKYTVKTLDIIPYRFWEAKPVGTQKSNFVVILPICSYFFKPVSWINIDPI